MKNPRFMKRCGIGTILLMAATLIAFSAAVGAAQTEPWSENPDSQDIDDSNESIFVLYPIGNPPPLGSIKAFAKAQYTDGATFSIDDDGTGPRPAVTFEVNKDAGGLDDPRNVEINITSANNAVQVGLAIAAAITNVEDALYIKANANPDTGIVQLSYDYKTDPLSAGNDVIVLDGAAKPMPAGSITPWVQGTGVSNDIRNVQWAVDHVAPGGTVVLKQSSLANPGVVTPFHLGNIGQIHVTQDLHIRGEYTKKAPFSKIGSGGWVESGTTIFGGRRMILGTKDRPISFTLKDIIFDLPYIGAVNTPGIKGYNEISGCTVKNFYKGRTNDEVAGVVGAFPIITHGGQTPEDVASVTGTLKVMNNFFGRPVLGPVVNPGQPYTPANMLNSLMHFSNCDLELEISGNEIEDCAWGGFLVMGNKGHSVVTRNTINKTKSYLDGVGISIGLTTSTYLNPYTYTGSTEVTNNMLTISSANSYGIAVTAYPGDLSQPVTHLISGNTITINGSERAAMACMGDCSNTTWTNNTVSGTAMHGILVTRALPPAPMAQLPPEDTLRPSNNTFLGNNLKEFTASLSQLLLQESQNGDFKNNDYGPTGYYEEGEFYRGLAGAYLRGYSTGNVFTNENFWGNYTGIMDPQGNPVVPPFPCLWFAGGSTGNTVSALKNGQALQGFDLCTQIFFQPGSEDNTFHGYDKCLNVPQEVILQMMAREAEFMERC